MKATAIAPSNIAFIKYWGKKDEALRLPENGSISLNLSELHTTTTVEFSDAFQKDSLVINGKEDPQALDRVSKQLDRIRKLATISQHAKVVSQNSFPSASGLSSSASGFAALTVAAATAAQLALSEQELSILSRQASGSSCRSIPDGFVEWLDGDTNETSYAVSLFPPDYWKLIDVVAIVSTEKKDIPTSEGQQLVATNPFFAVRRSHMGAKIQRCRELIKDKNFPELGELIEAEALELHALFFTSTPPLIYLLPQSLSVINYVQQMRKTENISAYFTLNTGQNVHILCEEKTVPQVIEHLKKLPFIQNLIVNFPAVGTKLSQNHLF